MKRLIYQVYIGKRNNLYDFCTNSVKNYCKKYEIDHIVQKEPILKIVPDLKNSKRNPEGLRKNGGFLPIFEKENAFSYLNKYDQIAIIDADIYCKISAPNIFDELPQNYDFGAVVEREMPITNFYKRKIKNYSKGQYGNLRDVDWKWNDFGGEFMNMGLMVLNSSIKKFLKNECPKEFIRRPEFKDFVDGKGDYKWSTDQTLLNYWIRRENMSIKKLNWKWNGMYKAIHDYKLKDAHFVHFFLKDHLPNKGENIEELIKYVQ